MDDRVSKYADEVFAKRLAVTFIVSLCITLAGILVVTPLHELLHYVGVLIEGGAVTEVVWVDVGNWASAYIHPIVVESAELGYVSATFENGGLFGGLFVYFLPYVVMFPLSLVLMLGSYSKGLLGVEIDDMWRLLGGPMFISTFGAFWTDFSLYMGYENVFVPYPAIVWQFLYLGVIVSGVVGSTVYFFVLDYGNR